MNQNNKTTKYNTIESIEEIHFFPMIEDLRMKQRQLRHNFHFSLFNIYLDYMINISTFMIMETW